MSIEIEAKMKLEDFDAMRRRLVEAGATQVGTVLETNTFFDTDLSTLVSADKGLRLRRTRDVSSGQEHFVITVKGPQADGPLKTREEAEVNVEDGDRAADVLRALGFHPSLAFEKRRESWTLAGCKIELDELPILGRFVEIEGPAENAVMRVREMLHLSDRPLIKTGYISMLSKHLRETSDSRKSITFQGQAL
jgi:adenylate cyclase class 2